MDEDKNKNRWAESLDEAGLLDEIEDGWSLPDDVLVSGSTIQVEGKGKNGESSPSVSDKEIEDADVPFAIPVSSEIPPPPRRDEIDELPRTPLERIRSSNPVPYGRPVANSLEMAQNSVTNESKSLPERSTPVMPLENMDSMRRNSMPSILPMARKKAVREPEKLDSLPPLRPLEELEQSNRPTEDDKLASLPPLRPLNSIDDFSNRDEDFGSLPPLEPITGDHSSKEETEERVVSVRGERITIDPQPIQITARGAISDILDTPPDFDDTIPPGDRLSLDGFKKETADGKITVDPMALVEDLDDRRARRLEMRGHFDIGDYSGALEIADNLLEEDAEDEEALEFRKSCRDTLVQMYESRIGSFEKVPAMAIGPDEIIWRNLNPATGFVISRIDGMLTFEDIIDISGLPRFETCRILGQLLIDGIIK
jgi:hypothetical protein